MSALVRTRSDGFSIEDCASPGQLEADPALLEEALSPPDRALGWMPRAGLSAADAARFGNGIAVAVEGAVAPLYRVYTGETFLGIGHLDENHLIPHKIYRED